MTKVGGKTPRTLSFDFNKATGSVELLVECTTNSIYIKDIYNYNEPYENVILTGLVALFGICFEQSWKAMKEVLGMKLKIIGFNFRIKTFSNYGRRKNENDWFNWRNELGKHGYLLSDY